ncbi:hypothetical protein KXW37_002572, partial [Aspergillus fumigatus]
VTAGFQGPQKFDDIYLEPLYTSQGTTGVLLPLLHDENYAPHVLLAGAPQPVVASLTLGPGITNSWMPTSPRNLIDPNTRKLPYRYFSTATILPTGDVVVTGGVLSVNYTEDPNDQLSGGVRQVEIYHPASGGKPDSWSVGAAAHEVRGYHSSALLTPDGSIWTAGSEIEKFTPGSSLPKVALPKLSIELYRPTYWNVPHRPRILEAPDIINYAAEFTVAFTAEEPSSPDRAISRVVLMRFGSCTHSFDGDQRYISIPFVQNACTLTVAGPPDGTVAPPG